MTEEEIKVAAGAEIEFWQKLTLCFMSRLNVTAITLDAADLNQLEERFDGHLPALAVTVQTIEQKQFVKLNLYNPKEAEAFAEELKKEKWQPSEG